MDNEHRTTSRVERPVVAVNAPSAGKLRALMLVENCYPQDVRIRNEALALTGAGHQVTVIALRGKPQSFREDVDGVRVYRVPALTLFRKGSGRKRASRLRRATRRMISAFGYFCEYSYFTLACLLVSIWVSLTRGFDVVHAHNPPDTLFVVGGFFRLFGKKFIFDHHDLSPELYLSRFRTGRRGLIYRILLALEYLSLRVANASIATNESYRSIHINRGKVDPDRVFVVRNGPDLERVREVPGGEYLRKPGKKILVFVGAMNPQDGVHHLCYALHHLAYTLKRDDFYCLVIGGGDSLEYVKKLTRDLKLEEYVHFTGFIVDSEQLMLHLSAADICLEPGPSNPLNELSTTIKVMEYMALGKPIVGFDLKESRFTAEKAMLYVKPNDELEFAKSVCLLMDDSDLRREMGEFGRRRIQEELQWDRVSSNLLQAYDFLNGRKARAENVRRS